MRSTPNLERFGKFFGMTLQRASAAARAASLAACAAASRRMRTALATMTGSGGGRTADGAAAVDRGRGGV